MDLVSRGYVMYGGLKCRHTGRFYLNIPKNASSWTTNTLVAAGWDHHISTGIEKETLILLRDPVERWISGFATYCSSWILGENYGSDHFVEHYNEAVERLIFDVLIFDDHTTPQIDFVDTIRGPKTFMFIDKNKSILQSNLSKYIGTELTLQHFDNANELNYDTKHLTMFFTDIIKSKGLEERIKKKYYKDYELLERIKFYGT